ncbi:hypothetical protein [Asticcacaulis sp. 201]|uniref:glycine-rich domain-containing protein n=1 Tax=Asticcacaulis sp. 201 TaxID=3028787 RepID=UPI0029165507|nr:hypothetical protein [Asticcacaulis sp. 201]MDV6329292.1 hypothetical protein [Asticcacaulis sp. 201]
MVLNTALWQAINAYELDNADAAFPFSRRLARDNGWSLAFALSAIAEYKRFIYLICVSGTVLTPSEEIDAVWHLHLLYTRDYWSRFCAQTLGRDIHHGPTRGGSEEAEKYLGCYRDTLIYYEQEFGVPPPRFWPDEATRFTAPPPILLNPDDHIILPKRQVFLYLSLAGPLVLAGCEMAIPVSKMQGPIVWAVFAAIGLVVCMLNIAKIRKHGFVGFIILATFMIAFGEFWLSPKLQALLSQLSGGAVDASVSQGLIALLAMMLAIQLQSNDRRGGSGSGCGGGSCGGSGDIGHGGCGGASGCGSGCGGGCGGGD